MNEYTFDLFKPKTQQRTTHHFHARCINEAHQLLDMWLAQNPGWMLDKLA